MTLNFVLFILFPDKFTFLCRHKHIDTHPFFLHRLSACVCVKMDAGVVWSFKPLIFKLKAGASLVWHLYTCIWGHRMEEKLSTKTN